MLLFLLTGLVIGSFISAYTYRAPRLMSWVGGRSFCPGCKKKLSWFDNIPVISYLLLLGRCRSCRKKISPRYPLIELVSGLSFVGLGSVWGNYFYSSPIELLFILFLFVITFSVFVIDLENQFIPDKLVFFGIILTFFCFVILDKNTIYLNLLSGFVSAFFLLTLHLITKGKGMGLGDVKFAILGGLVLGWPNALIWMFLSFIIGAFVGIVLILFKKASFGKKISFGPYLVVSLWLALIYGNWFLTFLV